MCVCVCVCVSESVRVFVCVCSLLTRGQQTATASTDDFALAAHVGQLGGLQGSCLRQVYGDLTEAACRMDLRLQRRERRKKLS